MKNKLQTMLSAKEQRKADLVKSIEASESVDDIKRFSADLETVNGEIRDLEGMIAMPPLLLPKSSNLRPMKPAKLRQKSRLMMAKFIVPLVNSLPTSKRLPSVTALLRLWKNLSVPSLG